MKKGDRVYIQLLFGLEVFLLFMKIKLIIIVSECKDSSLEIPLSLMRSKLTDFQLIHRSTGNI